MIIKHLKKIVVTDLLALFSLILTGCSQPGANMMGHFIEVKRGRFDRCEGHNISVKNTLTTETVKTIDSDVMVSYEIRKSALHRLCFFNPMPGSGFDPDLWARESIKQGKHERYWFLVKEIIPEEFRSGIRYLNIFDRKDSRTFTRICPEYENTLKIFSLGMPFNLFDLESCYSDYMLGYPLIICALIHEFGHYLEMHNGQQCSLSGDSILKINSIVPIFKIISESNVDCKDAYVTKYAKTSWVEDFAETFVYFVLLKYPPKLDASASIAMKKVLLFYTYPKFLQIRKAIRENLDNLGIHPKMSRDELKKLGIYPSTSDAN